MLAGGDYGIAGAEKVGGVGARALLQQLLEGHKVQQHAERRDRSAQRPEQTPIESYEYKLCSKLHQHPAKQGFACFIADPCFSCSTSP